MFFLIVMVILFNAIAYFIPKRITPIEMLTTTLFATFLQILTDTYLCLKYDFYGYFDKGPDWETLIYIFGIYPAVNIIFLNYFPYKRVLFKKIVYILIWGVIAMFYETLFIWTGTFYLNGWKQVYSIFTYPVLYVILMLFHKFTAKMIEKSRER